MAKKIMVLAGSPRKNGNTNTVTGWFVDAAREKGAEVELVDAAQLKYKVNGCTECMGCQQSDKYECVIDDEASPVIARMPQFDALVFATPVFWFGPSAQLKLLLDRTFALIKFDEETGEPISENFTGKTLCLIATAGGDQEGGLDLLDSVFRTATVFLHCRYESLLVPFAPHDPQEMADRTDVKEQAVDLAQKLC